MKKLLLISAAFAVLLAPAMAAEKPVRVHKRVRPVVVAAPVYSWTGFYIGANLGGGWHGRSVDYTPNDGPSALLLGGLRLTSASFDTSGVIGGSSATTISSTAIGSSALRPISTGRG
jgi:outer membrane immunogenic protein